MTVKARYPRYQDYTGGKLWRVAHPSHGTLECIAPDSHAAMTVAAEIWSVRWQSIEFYEHCQVRFVGSRKDAAVSVPVLRC